VSCLRSARRSARLLALIGDGRTLGKGLVMILGVGPWVAHAWALDLTEF